MAIGATRREASGACRQVVSRTYTHRRVARAGRSVCTVRDGPVCRAPQSAILISLAIVDRRCGAIYVLR